MNYTGVYKDMSHRIVKIIDNNVRVLLYYGDTDMMCNFVGGQKFADSLDFKVGQQISHRVEVCSAAE